MAERDNILNWLLRLGRHLWQSERAAWHAVPDNLAARLTARVRASEQRHSGQIRVCVEAALPLSYAWRAGRQAPLHTVVRQRAMAWFGRLRVWDTEHNNGVLIYLLLAERRIEILADRGLMRHTTEAHWQTVVLGLRQRLQAGDFETGLTQALEEVSALLMGHFASDEHHNELPDLIVRA
jgi:uncharacterized membrane protein